MKNVIKIIIPILIIIPIASLFLSNNNHKKENINSNPDSKKTKIYEHIYLEKITKTNYFKGEFIANDVISIYPRRDAIVKDILVDIGDEVKPGDTLAILFNSGVEGEAQAKINLKDTILESKNNLLKETENLKNSKIQEIDQKIIEKEILLQETSENFNKKIYQIGNSNTSGSEYQVEIKSLENLKTNLANAIKIKKEIIEDSENNISQKKEQLNSKIDEIYNKIIPILYLGNEQRIDYKNINSKDISYEFGAKNSDKKDELISSLEDFNLNYLNLETEKKYFKIIKIIDLFNLNLQNTIISNNITNKIIENNISMINSFKLNIISQNEILEDAIKNYNIINNSQNEKIENLEILIEKKENEIALLTTKTTTLESEKNLGLSRILLEIENLKKSRNVLIANEQKNITTIQNDINIAKSELNNEFIKSGDYKIIATFGGKITKRNIEIGEKISVNNEAFRISGVKNSLSKITKKEIKFYVPQEFKNEIKLKNQVYFDIGNESKSFTGEIYRISPEVDENTLSIIVQAKVDENLSIPNKSTLRVGLETTQNIYKIPTSTIYNKNQRKIIYYKKDNGKLGVKDVEIISNDGEYSLVSGDLNEKLKIVSTPIFIK